MKRKLGIMFIIIGVLFLAGCFGSMTPSEKVEDLFSRYIRNDEDILEKVDTHVDKQNLTEEQKQKYKSIIENEYSTIKYAIKDETIDGDEATVEANIEVKDLYRASKEAGEYLKDHQKEFYTDGNYDESKFKDYKLEVMKNFTDTVKYNVLFNLTKIDGIWTIDDIDTATLEKIHGIYDYEIKEVN